MNQEDVIKLVEGMERRPKVSDDWINFRCIFAEWFHDGGTDRRPSAGISINDEGPSYYNCYTCKHGGFGNSGLLVDVFQRYQWMVGENLGKFLAWIDDRHDEDMKRARASGKPFPGKKKDAPIGRILNDMLVHREEEIAAYKTGEYHPMLEARRIWPETAKKWEVGFDTKRSRITFPIRRHDGALLGLQGRTVIDASPPYYFYWSFPRASCLLGAQFLSPKNTAEPLILVEGPFDAMRVAQAGYRVVAVFGSQPAYNQAQIIQLFTESRVVAFFDADKPGDVGARVTKYLLGAVVPVFAARPPDGKDPADLHEEQVQELVENAEFVIGATDADWHEK